MHSLNTCYTGTVEIIGGYILEQYESVRAVPELIVWARRGRQSNFSALSLSPFCIMLKCTYIK